MANSNHKSQITNPKSKLQGMKGGQASRSTSSGSATSMAELMAKAKTPPRAFKKGEIIEGTITKLTSVEILVDIGAKTEAVVLEKDKALLKNLLDKLRVGDKITVSVLNPESDLGYPVVSLRRFMENRVWEKIEKLVSGKADLEITITGITKGGFLARTDDEIGGFLPNSQTVFVEELESLVGSRIKAIILEAQRDTHKIIFSQKEAVNESDFEKIAASIKAGQTVKATVTNIAPFGLFVSIPSGDGFLEGLIHVSEVSWDKIDDLSKHFKLRDIVDAQIIDIDLREKRLNLSIKRLTKDPFDEMTKEYSLDKKFSLPVLKISDTGITVDLGNEITGIIKKEKLPPGFEAKEGQTIEIIVSGVDKRRRRVEFVPVLKAKPIGYR
ncbi:MAG: 30S ribosomal protein S1 [Candidatus Levybacteria bacterium GW2011_GWA2_40_8]|nr:MAG: 30S ribosomal protein S1 [Candidatus Levybacteria bacterium GW2011_GWA2_40_8]